MKRLSVFMILPLFLAGCYGSTDSYWGKVSELECKQLKECDLGAFEAAYSSMSDCIDTRRENGIDLTATCEYDADQGRECISTIKQYKNECNPNAAEFTEIAAACLEVHYSCGLGVGYSYDPTIREHYISSIDPSADE